MKKLFFFLSVLLAFISVKAQNIDPRVYPFSTLNEALTTKMQTGARFSVVENGVQGTFTVTDRGTLQQDSGIVFFKGSTQAIVRDTSQATNGFDLRWFYMIPNDTSLAVRVRNRKIINKLLTDSVPYRNYIVKGGAFYFDSSTRIEKYVYLHGPNAYEMLDIGNAMSKFVYPKGITGIIVNNNNASSSRIEGFNVQGTLPTGGRLVDYNSDDGNVLLLAPILAAIKNTTYEVGEAYHAEKVKGTFIMDSVGTTGLDYDIEFIQPYGKFHVGDTVTGMTSGAKAIVGFASKHYNLIVCKQINVASAWNKKYETLKNGKGDTAVFYALPSPTRFQYTRVGHISSTTGGIDGTADSTFQDSSSIVKAGDSTDFAVSGTLDTIGSGGKRLNVFREQGTYCYGILIQRRCEVINMAFYDFGGEGGYITNAIKPFTNANLARIEYSKFSVNGSSGLKIEGGDANHVTVQNCTFVGNNGFALIDLSFLGISVSYTHSSLNTCGSYTSGNYLNRNSTFINPYSEGGYALAPYTPANNYLGGGATAIGGTWGGANDVSYWRSDGYGGTWFDSKHLQNTDFYTDQTIGNRSIVFKSNSSVPHPVTLESRGNPGAGRGPALRFNGPFGGSGYQGPVETKSGMIPYGEIQGTFNTTGAYTYAFKLRRNAPPTATVTDAKGKGKGAFIAVNTLGGKVTSVDILAGGKSYSMDSTFITIANPTDTVAGHKAVLIPYIEDSVLAGVYVKDSGLLYLDDDMVSVYELSANGVFRNLTGNGSLGDAAHPIIDAYISNLHTTAGAFTYPDSLVAKTATATGSTSMVRLYTTGNTAPGRGPTVDFYGPAGTGIPAIPYGSMQFVLDGSYKRSFNLNLDDDSSIANTILWAKSSQVAINTTVPNSSAIFQVHSLDKGSIPFPRMNSSQINAVTGKSGGLGFFNRQRQKYWYFDSLSNGIQQMVSSDTATIADYNILIGDASNNRFNKGTLTVGAGLSITQTGKNNIQIANTSTGSTTAPVIMVVPTGNDTTTSTTQTNLNGLSTSLAANTKYHFEVNLQVLTTGTGGVHYQLTVPTGATYYLNAVGSTTSTAASAWNVYDFAGSQTETGAFAAASFAGGSSIASFHMTGVITTSSTAGTLQMQFRAHTAGELKTVLAGSNAILTTGQ